MSMTTSIQLTQNSKYKLHNGQLIPVTGFGTWQIDTGKAESLVYEALVAGYRHIDTAVYYGNQAECARAVRKFCDDKGVPRSDIWFTTKITNEDHGYEEAKRGIAKIAEDVKQYIDYVDLVLIHSPLTNKDKRLGTYKAMQEHTRNNDTILIKSLGVSNYGIAHLEELFAWDGLLVKPVINQLELHPWSPQLKIREWCVRHDIYLEAYSPLTSGAKLDDPELVELEKQYHTPRTEILLKWSYLQGFIVLVKSQNVNRIVENFNVLPKGSGDSDTVERFLGKVDLDTEVLTKLNKPNSHEVICWNGKDPTQYEG
ncbi:glycerol 2-dehydrogenase (NADP(+)) [Diutina catenulata]